MDLSKKELNDIVEKAVQAYNKKKRKKTFKEK
jgi:hypothetical protein